MLAGQAIYSALFWGDLSWYEHRWLLAMTRKNGKNCKL